MTHEKHVMSIKKNTFIILILFAKIVRLNFAEILELLKKNIKLNIYFRL